MPKASKRRLANLLEEHRSLMFAICARYVKGIDGQRDVISEATARTCERYDEIAGLTGKEFASQLARTVQSVARSYVRSEEARARREQLSADPSNLAGPEESVVGRIAFLETVSLLPNDQRAPFILSMAGLDYGPISVALEISEDQARRKAKDGRVELRKIIAHASSALPCHQMELIERYVDQSAEISRVERSRLKRHMEACGGCSQYLTEYARQREIVAALVPVLPLGLDEMLAPEALENASALFGWAQDIYASAKAHISSFADRPEVAQATTIGASTQGSGIRPGVVAVAVGAIVFVSSAAYTVSESVLDERGGGGNSKELGQATLVDGFERSAAAPAATELQQGVSGSEGSAKERLEIEGDGNGDTEGQQPPSGESEFAPTETSLVPEQQPSPPQAGVASQGGSMEQEFEPKGEPVRQK